MAIKNKNVWELLPWNIQVDILSRLSTKDLCGLQSVCKDWQSIIESPRLHMLQINANPNENAIIKHSRYDDWIYQIHLLSSNEIYEFDNSIMDSYNKTLILATSNGLVLVSVRKGITNSQLLVFNPITKVCIELPKLPNSHYSRNIFHLGCDFFEHDLQSSTYKIFFAWNSLDFTSVCIYNSSSQIWQSLDSISNLIPKYRVQLWPFSSVTYKNNIYVAISTSEKKLVMVVYNPIHDLWNTFDSNIESYDNYGRLIIANGRLFYVQVCDLDTTMQNSTISIFEIIIEDKSLIPIIQIMCPKEMQCHKRYMQAKFIFGFNNKITIMAYKKDVGITYDVCTHEQKEFRNSIAKNYLYDDVIYPFKYTLVSPKCRQILHGGL